MSSTPTVVVGVDGSPASASALVFAFMEASRRGALLRVVTVAHLPEYWGPVAGMGGFAMAAALPNQDEIVASALAEAHRMVDGVTAAHSDVMPGVTVTVEAMTGVPADVLVEVSKAADLLIVGHRGRGGLSSALLGSVGLASVLHAACPVTIVRPVPAPAEPEIPAAAIPAASSTVPAPA